MFLEFPEIQINITNQYSNSNKYIQQLKRSIIQLINKGHENICFYCNETQSDPLDFQKIMNVLSFANENGIKRIKIKTNGKHITKEILTELYNKGVLFFDFTVYGHTDQTHDNCSGVKNSFKNIFNSISILEQTKIYDLSVSPFIQLNIMIDADNYPYLESIVQLALQYKINIIELHFKSFNIVFSNIIPLIKKSIDLCLDNQYTKCWLNIMDIPACLLKDYEYFINDFYSQTNKQIHQKIFIENCQKCMIKNKCSGIVKEYIMNFGQEEFLPITDSNFANLISHSINE